jgi:hypothetical protein
MASRILFKSTSDGVKRWAEPYNVLGASVDGSSILKQVNIRRPFLLTIFLDVKCYQFFIS